MWYVEETRQLTFQQWWLELVQANAIASATVALAWTAARRWLYESHKPTLAESPLLSLQVVLPVAANAVLLLVPVVRLLQTPACLPTWMGELADAPGWMALLLAAAAAAWYLWHTLPGAMPHVLGGALLGAGVLAACSVTRIGPPNFADWLEYHVLTTAWAAAAMSVLGVGFVGRKLRAAEMGISPICAEHPPGRSGKLDLSPFPPHLIAGWVTLIGALAVVLAVIYSPVDRVGAWWSIRSIGAMSVAAAILALWLRLPIHVFLSGLLLSATGVVAWLAWGNPHDVVELVHIGVLCLAAASGTWTLLQLIVPQGVPHLGQQRRPVVFAHLAAAIGLAAMAALAACGVLCDLQSVAHFAVTRLAWIALAAVAASIAMTLWDRLARLSLCGLYVAGLAALSMFWDSLQPGPRELCWRMAFELAAFLLATAAFGWLLGKGKRTWQLLRVPCEAERWPMGWFMGLQALLAAVASGLAVWTAIDFAFDALGRDAAWFDLPGRMAGAAAR